MGTSAGSAVEKKIFLKSSNHEPVLGFLARTRMDQFRLREGLGDVAYCRVMSFWLKWS